MATSSHLSRDEIEISISREVHDALRIHCDQHNLRFKYFIEEVLENAPRQDDAMALSYETSVLLKKVKHLLDKMEAERRRSFERGFALGILAALLNITGYSGVSAEMLPEEIRQSSRPKPPTDDRQLSLFD